MSALLQGNGVSTAAYTCGHHALCLTGWHYLCQWQCCQLQNLEK